MEADDKKHPIAPKPWDGFSDLRAYLPDIHPSETAFILAMLHDINGMRKSILEGRKNKSHAS